MGWTLLRWILGGIFLSAGVIKAWDPGRFFMDISNYQILPTTASMALAWYLPWIEIMCGLCFFCKRFFMGATWILVGLMVIFVAALCVSWMRGLDLQCGCFGVSSGGSNYPIWLMRDLLILAGLGLILSKKGRAQALA